MTPYTKRRAMGFYNPTGETTKSTTTDNLAGLGAPQKAKPKPKAKKKK
jgi:hypothetical protein